MATVRFSKHELEILLEDNAGFCTQCQEITEESGIEPDAEEYTCGMCEGPFLEGVENALIMGHIEEMENETW